MVGTAFVEVLRTRSDATLCLPTGSTPRPMYRRFVDLGGDLAEASIFLLDEFGIPPGEAGRCDAALERDLLGRLPGRPASVATWNTEAQDIQAECSRFGALAESVGLDLTILGIGRNGHLGLNEPGSTPRSRARRVELHATTMEMADTGERGSPPTWGVTLGLFEILESARIWLLVTGEHKASILRDAMHGPRSPHVPASFLQGHPDVTVFADEGAAALL